MKISLDKNLYSRDALLKAAFMCIDKMYIHLEQDSNFWIVQCESKDGENIDPLEFENEIIRQELQINILKQNADLRKIILARAMASTIIEGVDELDELKESRQEENILLNSQEILKSWFENGQNNKI